MTATFGQNILEKSSLFEGHVLYLQSRCQTKMHLRHVKKKLSYLNAKKTKTEKTPHKTNVHSCNTVLVHDYL